MRILFLISGLDAPASRFRILQYVPRLQAAGHTCVVAPSIPPKYHGFRLLGNRASEWPRRMFRAWDILAAWWADYDVVYLERELFSTDFVVLERMLRRVARNLVLDVDDAIFVQQPQKFETLVKLSDCVVVGNRLLREKVSPLHSFVVEIPTAVDLARYAPVEKGGLAPSDTKNLEITASQGACPPFSASGPEASAPGAIQKNQRPVVGWTGLASNIAYLEVAAPALRELSRQCDFELQVIAESAAPLARLDLAGVPVRFIPWTKQDEIAALQRFDVGLMPLPDNEWARFKCGLKLIQYMALAIPGIASPVGVNAEIVKHGETGCLAATTEDWVDCLGRLLRDPALRREIGEAGRAAVAARYSLDQTAPVLIRTLEEVCARKWQA